MKIEDLLKANELSKRIDELKNRLAYLDDGCEITLKNHNFFKVHYTNSVVADEIASDDIRDMVKAVYAKMKEKLVADIEKLQKEFDEL